MKHALALPLPARFRPTGRAGIRRCGLIAVFVAVTATATQSHSSAADASIQAQNWPHWRGPTGNGTAPASNPPVRFGSTQNVKWKVPIAGKSSGSPVVWGDRVFAVTAKPAANGAANSLDFQVLCFDRETGKSRWTRTAITAVPHEPTHSTNTFASASPCTDGKRVYASFGTRGLYCYDLDGTLIWGRNDFPPMQMRNGFGEGSSPVLAGEMLILPWDHEGQSFLYALDKTTGQTIWQVARDEPSCWATPLVIDTDSGPQIIMNGQNRARAYDLETGAELWSCGGQTQRPVACPVTDGRLVFVGSGFRGAFLGAFDPSGRGNLEGTPFVKWSVDRDTPDMASLLFSQGRLYYFKEKTGILTCVDAASGRPFYQRERVPGLRTLYASPIAAGGYVFITDRSGNITVIRDAATFEVVAENAMGETVDATPAAVDNQLFIRGENHLFCIESST